MRSRAVNTIAVAAVLLAAAGCSEEEASTATDAGTVSDTAAQDDSAFQDGGAAPVPSHEDAVALVREVLAGLAQGDPSVCEHYTQTYANSEAVAAGVATCEQAVQEMSEHQRGFYDDEIVTAAVTADRGTSVEVTVVWQTRDDYNYTLQVDGSDWLIAYD